MNLNKHKKGKRVLNALVWLGSLCILIVGLKYINENIFTVAIVNGESMYPSICDGDILVVDCRQKMPVGGDVILISVSPNELGGDYLVKRVIATGGETITIDYDKNEVYVNGELLSEPYINLNLDDPMWAIEGKSMVEYRIPQDYVFVMGDNRNFSSDSRNPTLGAVEKNKIIGTVVSRSVLNINI